MDLIDQKGRELQLGLMFRELVLRYASPHVRCGGSHPL